MPYQLLVISCLRPAWLFVMFGLFFTTSAQAGISHSNYEIDWVANSNVRGNQSEALFLGRHLRTDVFLLPYQIVDEGYVMGVQGSRTDYYPLPPERVLELQQTGQLPKNLPVYRFKLIDMLIGNALWLPLLVVYLYLLVRRSTVLSKRKQELAAELSGKTKDNLGAVISTYGKNWELQKLHSILLVFSFMPLLFGWTLASLPLLLVGMLILTPVLLMVVSQFNYRITLYERGICVLGPLDASLAYFSPGLSIRENHARNSSNLSALFSGRLNDCLSLENKDDKNQVLIIPSNIDNMGQLLTYLRKVQTDILLPHVVAKYHQGSTLDFSAMKIRKTQIMAKNKVINAADIGSIEVKNSLYRTTLIIKKRAVQNQVFCRLNLSALTNFCILLPVLDTYFNPATKKLNTSATDAPLTPDKPLVPDTNTSRVAQQAEDKPASADTVATLDPRAEAMFAAIAERRKVEPLVGAKLGGQDILKRLMAAMNDDKGVHIESLLSLLGSLAGYACQMRARAQLSMQPPSNGMEIVRIDCDDGTSYFMGDAINRPLAEGQYSVWSLICGAAENKGAKPEDRPDLHALFTHVSRTLGTPEFGQPRLPSGFSASDTPLNYLLHFWPVLQPIAERYCGSPAEWPILYAGAIQDVMDQASTTMPGYIAVAIVMESAIPMSKINPALLAGARP